MGSIGVVAMNDQIIRFCFRFERIVENVVNVEELPRATRVFLERGLVAIFLKLSIV